MKPPVVYVTRNWRRKWVVRLTGQYDNQMVADNVGRSVAQKLGTEYELRARNGTVREKNTYKDVDDPNVPG